MSNSLNPSVDQAVYLLATLDTKGQEAAYVRDRLAALGVGVKLIDTGCLGTPSIQPDISWQEIFHTSGVELDAVARAADRGEAVKRAAAGAVAIVGELFRAGKVAGVMGMGGSAGTTIGTAVMRSLPLGLPKVMISTHASGNTQGFVGHKDIVMINPIVDIAGLNRISRIVLAEAAAAMAGMVQFQWHEAATTSKPVVAATMFGVTTPCVQHARAILEAAGYEVLVFHATGTGGQAMESLIADGAIAGVLDITTTELADELCGGVLSAGPTRLTTAGRMKVPQVISVGATDMVNFHGMDTVPEHFRYRRLYQHNEHVTLMRTTPEENTLIGQVLAERAAAAQGPTAIYLPLQGVSAIDKPGQPFDDPEARQALFDAIAQHAENIEVVALEHHINDPAFAEAAARKLLSLMNAAS